MISRESKNIIITYGTDSKSTSIQLDAENYKVFVNHANKAASSKHNIGFISRLLNKNPTIISDSIEKASNKLTYRWGPTKTVDVTFEPSPQSIHVFFNNNKTLKEQFLSRASVYFSENEINKIFLQVYSILQTIQNEAYKIILTNDINIADLGYRNKNIELKTFSNDKLINKKVPAGALAFFEITELTREIDKLNFHSIKETDEGIPDAKNYLHRFGEIHDFGTLCLNLVSGNMQAFFGYFNELSSKRDEIFPPVFMDQTNDLESYVQMSSFIGKLLNTQIASYVNYHKLLIDYQETIQTFLNINESFDCMVQEVNQISWELFSDSLKNFLIDPLTHARLMKLVLSIYIHRSNEVFFDIGFDLAKSMLKTLQSKIYPSEKEQAVFIQKEELYIEMIDCCQSHQLKELELKPSDNQHEISLSLTQSNLNTMIIVATKSLLNDEDATSDEIKSAKDLLKHITGSNLAGLNLWLKNSPEILLNPNWKGLVELAKRKLTTYDIESDLYYKEYSTLENNEKSSNHYLLKKVCSNILDDARISGDPDKTLARLELANKIVVFSKTAHALTHPKLAAFFIRYLDSVIRSNNPDLEARSLQDANEILDHFPQLNAKHKEILTQLKPYFYFRSYAEKLASMRKIIADKESLKQDKSIWDNAFDVVFNVFDHKANKRAFLNYYIGIPDQISSTAPGWAKRLRQMGYAAAVIATPFTLIVKTCFRLPLEWLSKVAEIAATPQPSDQRWYANIPADLLGMFSSFIRYTLSFNPYEAHEECSRELARPARLTTWLGFGPEIGQKIGGVLGVMLSLVGMVGAFFVVPYAILSTAAAIANTSISTAAATVGVVESALGISVLATEVGSETVAQAVHEVEKGYQTKDILQKVGGDGRPNYEEEQPTTPLLLNKITYPIEPEYSLDAESEYTLRK